MDNNDLYRAIYSEKHVTERRLRIEINSFKQLIENKDIASINWIQTEKQIANVLTKNGASGQNILNSFSKGRINF